MFLLTTAKATAGFVASEEFNAVGKYVFQKRCTLVSYSLRALYLRDAFIVVSDVTVRKTAECHGKFMTIVLDLDIAKIWMCGWKRDHDIVCAVEPH